MHHVAHSDWMFDHSLGHHPNTSADPSTDTSQVTQSTQTDAAASVAKTLWHQSDGGSSSSTQASSGSSASSNTGSSTASPTLTVTSNALTVNAGGSVSLPISVSPANGHTAVTIAGLTNYETVTDSLDGKTFTPDANGSITLSAAEVNSGLSLASNYTGTDHPVNTLTITAAETSGHHTETSASQTITVTDPPASTSGSGSSTSGGSDTLTLQVSGDQYNGDPQIEVFVDGQQFGGTYTVTADHASGQTQTITITGNFSPSAAHQVQVEFVNDAWDGTSWWTNGGSPDGHDRNVYVESITLNGQTLNGSQGTDTADPSGAATDSNPNEAPLYTNGTVTFSVPAESATAASSTSASTSGSGSSTSSASTDPSTSTSTDPSTSTSTDPSTSTSTDPSTSTSTDPSTSTVGTGASDPAQTTDAFYVSPNGSDSNSGTLAAPFATLAHAQQAMEGSSIKTTYVEGGTYNISSTITLTAADNGETWQYYQPDGVNSAVLDGGGSVNIFALEGVSNVTIDGLKMQNVGSADIYTPGDALNNNVTIENCDLGLNSGSGTTGAIMIDNATNTLIENNYIHDTVGNGITLMAFNAGDSINGSVITGNVVENTVQSEGDEGAIYISMRDSGTSGGHVTISDNYIADTGSSATGTTGDAGNVEGIYLDDNASNVTITGNTIAPLTITAESLNNSSAIFIHNGADNTITGNIIDLGSSGEVAAVNWGEDGGNLGQGMSGSTFTNNIVLSDFTGALQTLSSGVTGEVFFENGGQPASDFTIANNVYYNYASGGQAYSNGNLVSDSNPVVENPQISGWTYTIASGSPVFSSPVSFTAIAGEWGPQGFAIAETGTTPSTVA
jgi:Ca-dependent carbohydrate-binding module xylan-binding/Protein of unknown function (DUF1565)